MLPMVATPATVCFASLASRVSVWLSPPKGMWMLITGDTFMRKSTMAAATCESGLLSLMLASVPSRVSEIVRACCCEIA